MLNVGALFFLKCLMIMSPNIETQEFFASTTGPCPFSLYDDGIYIVTSDNQNIQTTISIPKFNESNGVLLWTEVEYEYAVGKDDSSLELLAKVGSTHVVWSGEGGLLANDAYTGTLSLFISGTPFDITGLSTIGNGYTLTAGSVDPTMQWTQGPYSFTDYEIVNTTNIVIMGTPTQPMGGSYRVPTSVAHLNNVPNIMIGSGYGVIDYDTEEWTGNDEKALIFWHLKPTPQLTGDFCLATCPLYDTIDDGGIKLNLSDPVGYWSSHSFGNNPLNFYKTNDTCILCNNIYTTRGTDQVAPNLNGYYQYYGNIKYEIAVRVKYYYLPN